MLEQIAGTPGSEGLLVRHGGKGETPGKPRPHSVQQKVTEDRCRGSGFHIAGAAAIDSTVDEVAAPGIKAPSGGFPHGKDIDVTVENQMSSRRTALEESHDIRHIAHRRNDSKRDTFRFQKPANEIGSRPGVAGRVWTSRPDEATEEVQDLAGFAFDFGCKQLTFARHRSCKFAITVHKVYLTVSFNQRQ